MASMNEFGNNLYTGKTSFPFVGRRRLWFIIAIVLVVGSALVPLFRPIQFSISRWLPPVMVMTSDMVAVAGMANLSGSVVG